MINKIANISIDDKRELDVGRLGGYIAAPLMARAVTTKIINKIKKDHHIMDVWNYKGKGAFGNKVRIAAPVALAASVMGGLGYLAGRSSGKAAEKFLLVPKQTEKTASENKNRAIPAGEKPVEVVPEDVALEPALNQEPEPIALGGGLTHTIEKVALNLKRLSRMAEYEERLGLNDLAHKAHKVEKIHKAYEMYDEKKGENKSAIKPKNKLF